MHLYNIMFVLHHSTNWVTNTRSKLTNTLFIFPVLTLATFMKYVTLTKGQTFFVLFTKCTLWTSNQNNLLQHSILPRLIKQTYDAQVMCIFFHVPLLITTLPKYVYNLGNILIWIETLPAPLFQRCSLFCLNTKRRKMKL